MRRRPGADTIDCGQGGKPSPGSSLSQDNQARRGWFHLGFALSHEAAKFAPDRRSLVGATPSTLKSAVGNRVGQLAGGRLAKCSEGPELRASIRSAAHGIAPA